MEDGLRRDVAADELVVTLESPGREHERLVGLGEWRLQPDVARGSDEHLGQSARVEALPDRARVPRLLPDDGRAERLEPRQRVVEPVDDQPLEIEDRRRDTPRRKSSSVRYRQTTQLERSIDPPGRLPFS